MLKTRVAVTLTALLCFGLAALVTAADEKADEGWISLFNGTDLAGWKASEGVEWKVENGEIVTPPKRSHLFTDMEFKNFEFKAECLTKPGSNSGLYFHTKYEDTFPNTGFEVQVNQTQGDPVKSGSLYNLVKVFSSPVKDDVLCGRPVTKATQIIVFPWVIHRHRKFWDHPTAFMPDRFAGKPSPWTSGGEAIRPLHPARQVGSGRSCAAPRSGSPRSSPAAQPKPAPARRCP
jgi:hypothetical protein